jgi:reversibly glycosylated polypeptide / UDP-arabinopyranose mutase
MEVRKFLVIPSIRERCIKDFFHAWRKIGDWDQVVVVEDQPERTFDLGIEQHYSWKEISECLGDKAWIFSKRDSAIRCFGYLAAYQNGADYILTLDDDCYPKGDSPVFRKHIQAMQSFSRWTTSVPNLRTRGIPYRNKGYLGTVVANMGFWSRVPDLDAIQALSSPIRDFMPPSGNHLIPNGQYFPMCGMNLCFVREAAPLMYFPLMGDGQPYRRFDDIWAGVIAKKVIDYLRWHISVGDPSIEHIRASNDFENLIKEAPGVKANEEFWEYIDQIKLNGQTPSECMKEIGEVLCKNKDEYISRLGKAILTWVSLFV